MKQFKFLAMAAIATIFASCSNDEEVTTSTKSLKDTPINVNVLMTDIQTRAGYDNTNQPEQFYLSINQDGENYDYTDVVMKKEDGKWVSYDNKENLITMLWEGSDANVTVTAATFNNYNISIDTYQSTDENLKRNDHLYYSASVKPSPNGISIPFNHIMSKLEISVTLRTEYEDATTNPITSVSVFGASTYGYYNLDDTGNRWSNQFNDSNVKTCPTDNYNTTSRTAKYEVILIPQTVAANTFGVEILVGDKTFRWTSAAAVTFDEGKKYTLALTVGKDKVSGNSFTASAWGGGTSISSKTE